KEGLSGRACRVRGIADSRARGRTDVGRIAEDRSVPAGAGRSGGGATDLGARGAGVSGERRRAPGARPAAGLASDQTLTTSPGWISTMAAWRIRVAASPSLVTRS